MKTYELIIVRQQPTCGGRTPTRSEIKTVTTDDPVAYVQKLDPTGKLKVENKENGVILITAEQGDGMLCRYEFTED